MSDAIDRVTTAKIARRASLHQPRSNGRGMRKSGSVQVVPSGTAELLIFAIETIQAAEWQPVTTGGVRCPWCGSRGRSVDTSTHFPGCPAAAVLERATEI